MTDHAPLYKAPGDEAVTTQYDMSSVERVGLIKFDFLGLKTLTVIEKCVEYLKGDGIELDMEHLPLDDTETYRFLGTGKTTGVFQLESDGMKDILIKMQPTQFEDVIALVALYRPGPIGAGMVDEFIRRKKSGKGITYYFDEIRGILEETYGIILYQEQVMSIANKLSGYSLGQADVLRKAMGKKIPEVMAEQKETFVKGAVESGHNERKAADLFSDISKFAEYGFNKSHSAAYAYIAYQTAYLKAHHPAYFMAATLSMDIDNSDKVVKNIKECRDMEIRVLPPDINLCGREFTVDGGHIRFGLGAVKGAGTNAVDAVLSARGGEPFETVEDYLSRVDLRKVNKKVNESLIKAGAFDSLSKDDGALEALGKARARAMEKLEASGGQIPSLSLFGDEAEEGAAPGGGWDEADLLKREKEALGFYISGNPMSRFDRMLDTMGIRSVGGLKSASDQEVVEAAGIVMSIRKLRTKRGEIMAALVLEDEDAMAEVILFPDLYQEYAGILDTDRPMLVRGTLEKSEKGMKIVSEAISPLEDLPYRTGENLRAVITIEGGNGSAGSEVLKALKDVVDSHRGELPLYLKIRSGGADTLLQTSHSIVPDMGFIEKVEGFFGKGSIKVL
jgi:DNA polymerase-3 subunit alpha